MESTQEQPWDVLRSLITDNDQLELEAYVHNLTGSQVIRALYRLTEGEQRQLLVALSPEVAAEVIEDVPDSHVADLIEAIPVIDAALIVAALPSDDQADVLAEVQESEMELILGQMEPAAAASARELMSYDPGSAGGLMVTEYLQFQSSATVRDVFAAITSGERGLSNSVLQRAYVINYSGALLGWVRIRDLVNAGMETQLKGILAMPTLISVYTDLLTLRECFQEVDAQSLPVVDDQGVLHGVVLRSDLDGALAEKAEEDYLKTQGIVGGEELRSMPLIQRCRRRLSWLSVNILLNILAASVIVAFEDTLAALIALAVFLPIVSDMSGCSGNQAVAISMRELTLGIVTSRDVFRVWLQEVKVGLINGCSLGLLLGFAAWVWKGDLVLAGVVGVALSLNTVIAVSIGGTVPLVVKHFGADPAVASGPVLTTITDMCGFFLVLGIATLALPWL